MKLLKLFFQIFLILFFFYSSSYSCDDVWKSVLDAEALERCHKKAESGEANAQFEYGLWLIRIPEKHRNVSEGIEWITKSAKKRHFLAQVALGMFLSGEKSTPEISRDYILSYAWLATAQQNSALEKLEKKMTADELSKAKKLADTYIKKFTSDNIRNQL